MSKQLTPTATAGITDAEILELLTAFGDMAAKPVNKLIKGATSGFVKANGEFSQVWRDYAIRIAKECEAVATGESLQAASGTVSPAKVRASFAGRPVAYMTEYDPVNLGNGVTANVMTSDKTKTPGYISLKIGGSIVAKISETGGVEPVTQYTRDGDGMPIDAWREAQEKAISAAREAWGEKKTAPSKGK